MSETVVLQRPYRLKTYHLFLIILTCTLVNIYTTQNFIMTREVYHNLYSERLEAQRIDELVTVFKKFSVWSYIISPVLLLLRLTFVALLIQLPLVFKFIDIRFAKLFRIVTIAFIPLLLMQVIYITWLLRLPAETINEQTLGFVPLAITNLIDAADYPKHIYGFLGNFNLFEIAWGFLAATGLYKTGKLKKSDADLIVLCLWALILVFQFVLIMYLNKVAA